METSADSRRAGKLPPGAKRGILFSYPLFLARKARALSHPWLPLAKLLFQPGSLVFTETSSNVAAVEASHRIGLETNKHRLAYWAKLPVKFLLAEHHP